MFNFSVDMCCVLALCVREREREKCLGVQQSASQTCGFSVCFQNIMIDQLVQTNKQAYYTNTVVVF